MIPRHTDPLYRLSEAEFEQLADDHPRLWPEHWAVVAMVGASVVVGGYAFAKLAGWL